MQIDWFTLIAQLVNFAILIALLVRFLYRPIIRAMDEREKRIASRLEEADEKRRQAEEQARLYREQRSELESARQQTLDRAGEEAEARRKELIRSARREVDETQAQWRDAIEREKRSFLDDLRRRAGEEICEIAGRALKDLADRELQQHVVEVFLERLRQMPQEDRQALAGAIRESGNRILVRSAFPLPQQARERIAQALRERLAEASEVRFQIAEDLICGIELRSDGLKVSWNVASYLDVFEESLAQALAQGAEERRDH